LPSRVRATVAVGHDVEPDYSPFLVRSSLRDLRLIADIAALKDRPNFWHNAQYSALTQDHGTQTDCRLESALVCSSAEPLLPSPCHFPRAALRSASCIQSPWISIACLALPAGLHHSHLLCHTPPSVVIVRESLPTSTAGLRTASEKDTTAPSTSTTVPGTPTL
jgi:hypothetical protein